MFKLCQNLKDFINSLVFIFIIIPAIPSGQLKAPFFDEDYPPSINYGNIGATVGHEFTHGLDDEGRQYDEIGNLHNWWSMEAVERFNNRSECYIQQYSHQKEPSTRLNVIYNQFIEFSRI